MRPVIVVGCLMAALSCTPSGVKIEAPDASFPGMDSGVDAGDGDRDADAEIDEEVDEDKDATVAAPVCYLDRDNDGVGAGDAVDCDDPYAGEDVSADAGIDADAGDAAGEAPARPGVVDRGDDCDDTDPSRAPTLAEVCDGIDNDCDGEVDEGAKNACGGTCERPFVTEPGDACDNGLLGACARTGKYVCKGLAEVVCDAAVVVPRAELCADGIDNDCDGDIDEPDAADAVTWYRDCDGDGYAGTLAGAARACAHPADQGGCGWTDIVPILPQSTNANGTYVGASHWDCDDSSADYRPGASFGFPRPGSTSWNRNCDGVLEADASFQASLPKACPAVTVRFLNGETGGGARCEERDFDGSLNILSELHCTTWRDASGKYVTTPSQTCPDSPYRASISTSWGSCAVEPMPRTAVVPCR